MSLVIKKRKPISDETRKKISETLKGRTSWNKGKPAPWARERMIKDNPAKREENRNRMIKNNPMSHGGEVAYKRKDYKAVHAWVYRAFGRSRQCEKCNIIDERPKAIHWANISGQYKRERRLEKTLL